MITYADAIQGRVSLAEIADMNQYLDMIDDIQAAAMDDAAKKARQGGGGRHGRS